MQPENASRHNAIGIVPATRKRWRDNTYEACGNIQYGKLSRIRCFEGVEK